MQYSGNVCVIECYNATVVQSSVHITYDSNLMWIKIIIIIIIIGILKCL